MRTIRVTGNGKMKIHPDLTRITMTLDGVFPQYGDALRHAAEDSEKLKDLLAGFGFAKNELKTLSLRVDPEYEGYQENNVYKQRLVGYHFRHTMKVEFASDNDRLGRILYALANNEAVAPEFQISYTVKDPEASKNALLAAAVADSRAKAQVLTEAAGVVLKDIQTIDYSWGDVNLEVTPMNRVAPKLMMAKASGAKNESYDMAIEPDDIEVNDTVTVVWEIG